jgi:hypothetical protein
MVEVIHALSTEVKDNAGRVYRAVVCAKQRPDGTWEGWLEFHPVDSVKMVLRTGKETVQSSRSAVEYWASGLEPIYLDGALARAQGRLP